jgi:crotonobetaine/carnitine-CoA ligase
MGVIDQDGALFFSGRSFSYIRRRGENISAGELEAVFLGHPDIAECAVVGVPSELGEDDVKVAAVARPGARLEAAQIYAFAAERVARFMRPRYVEVLAELPRNDMGKVQIAALKQNRPLTWDAERDLNS